MDLIPKALEFSELNSNFFFFQSRIKYHKMSCIHRFCENFIQLFISISFFYSLVFGMGNCWLYKTRELQKILLLCMVNQQTLWAKFRIFLQYMKRIDFIWNPNMNTYIRLSFGISGISGDSKASARVQCWGEQQTKPKRYVIILLCASWTMI